MKLSRRHNFPPFPLCEVSVPSPAPLLKQLRAKALQGDGDPTFANILGHNKTRKVLLDGFRAVSNAISNLEGSLGSSFVAIQSPLGDEGQRSRDQLAEFHRSFEG